MAVEKNTFGIALSVAILAFVVNIMSSILVNFAAYGLVLGVPKIFAPDYNAVLIGVIIVIIMGVVTYLAIKTIPENYQLKSVLILGISIGILIGLVISPPFPLFEITSPTDNSAVDRVIMVRGHGGIPKSEIRVFVITDYLYPQDKAHPYATGKWSVHPVFIGEDDQHGLEAEIYAEMTTPDGNVYRSNFIKVNRK